MNRLSIVIPVYNAGRYLSGCIKNLLGQTFQDWEAVFVDDGSTDGSGSLLAELTAGEPRFHVVLHEIRNYMKSCCA